MKVITRQGSVSKSVEEATRILKSSAYYLPKAIFEKSAFSMHCARRRNGGYLSPTHIRGHIFAGEESTEVILEIHANLSFYLGCAIILLGLIWLLYGFLWNRNIWIPCLGTASLGLLISAQFLWEASEMLDLLEHKLTRSI